MPSDRNAPCPCGSGRKYKQCCLPGDELFELDRMAQAALNRGDDAGALELARRIFDRGFPLAGDDKVRRLLADSADAYAQLLQQAGESETAAAMLQEMAALDPEGRGEWLQQAGLTLISAGNGDAGLKLVEAAVQENDADPWRWAGLAEAFVDLHRLPEALDAAGRGLLAANWAPDAIRDRHGDARAHLHELESEIHFLRADAEAAERALEAAAGYEPEVRARASDVIRLWIARGRPERAERLLAGMRAPEMIRYLRGLLAYAAGRRDEARRQWAPLLDRRPQGRGLDTLWVEAQLLAGDRRAAAAYLQGLPTDLPAAPLATFYLALARGERPAPDPDPVLNWLAQLCQDRRDAGATAGADPPADPGPAGQLLELLMQGRTADIGGAARKAYRRHGAGLVRGLLAAMAGPRGMYRQLAETCLLELGYSRGMEEELRRFVADPAQPAGARGTAHIMLMELGCEPEGDLDPEVAEAAMRQQVEGLADLLEHDDYGPLGRDALMGMPGELRPMALEALPPPAHPAALAFHAWLMQEGKPAALRRAAERRLREGLGGAGDPEHWLGQARRLVREQDPAAAAACFELGARLMPPDHPHWPLAMWQWAGALVTSDEDEAARTVLRRLKRAAGPGFWAEQVAALQEGLRLARRRGDPEVRVRLDAAGEQLLELAVALRAPELLQSGISLWAGYLQVTDQPPAHVDQPAAWAMALAAVASALEAWDGMGPPPRWQPHLKRVLRAARADEPAARAGEPAARAVAAELWRVLDPAAHPDWIAAQLGWLDDPEDEDFDGEDLLDADLDDDDLES